MANNDIITYIEVITMGIIITDELVDFYAEEYRRKLEEGKIKFMNFSGYLEVMIHMNNLEVGLQDEYFKAIEMKYLQGVEGYGKEEK